jgi:hypothetical protein
VHFDEGDDAAVGVGIGVGEAICPEQPASVTHIAAAAATDIPCFKVIRA